MGFPFSRKADSLDRRLNDRQSEANEVIIQELLRQIRWSYNASLVLAASAACITLAGIGLLYLDKIPAASVTATGGALASLSSFHLSKNTKEELLQMIENFSEKANNQGSK